MIKYFALVLLSFFQINIASAQWINQLIPGNVTGLNCLGFLDSLRGISAGYYTSPPNQAGKILFTNNSGALWSFSQLPDSINNIRDIKIINSNLIYAAGSFVTNIDKSNFSKNIFHPEMDYCFEGTSSKGAFLSSTDQGVTWKAFGNIPANVNYFTSISVLNAKYGFANCDIGVQNTNAGMLRTTDGGQTWTSLNIPSDIFWLLSVNVIDSLNILSVGTKFTNIQPNQIFTGVILRTTNGGTNWVESMFPDVNGFNSIYFANSSTGFAVGNGNPTDLYKMRGTIYKTTNSGTNWINFSSSISDTSFLNSVKFLSNGTGIIQGNRNKILPNGDNQIQYMYILKSTDFGINWNAYKIVSGNYIGNKIEMVNEKKYYLCGYSLNSQGIVYYSSNGGETFVNNYSNEIPDKYFLYQNYPNPFNPSTVIEYSMPKAGFVSIKVFDSQGKFITELVNSFKAIGNYSVNFDGSQLASGVYFYRIEANNFIDTKRLVLIK